MAVYDPRENSKTRGVLNLFPMGQSQSENNQFLILIPAGTYHGFLVVSQKEATLLNFPTKLYDLSDEGRVPHGEANVLLGNKIPFSWNLVREAFK